MQVAQLMKHHARTCHAEDPLSTAAQVMWDYDYGCVPVVDGDSQVVGMITDRDVCMAAYTQGRPLGSLHVGDAMSRSVATCTPTHSLTDAEQLMRTHRVHRLPVVDSDGRLLGILSLADLAREAREQADAHRRALTLAQVGETLGAVCAPAGSRAVVPAR